MSIARELAQRVCAMRYAGLPPAAIEQAKICILDTVGVTLAGSREDAVRLAARALGAGTGPSLIFGTSVRVSPLAAARLNGTASHALDFDDSNNRAGLHPSAPVLSALFALADDIGCSGSEFITACVAGHEVSSKLAFGLNFHHYTKGWHPAATLGVFGTAAACTRLMGLNEKQTTTALAIAASLSSGIKANVGTMMKPMHIGHCASNGLYAALLARENYTAAGVDIFEHDHGFFNVYNGLCNYDASKILPGWARPLEVVSGISIKQYPCCGSIHAPIDALLMLARRHDLKPAQVMRIDAWIHARRLAHTDRPDPLSALDAKFSIQYCLARALEDRKIVLEQFEGDAFRDKHIRALMARVHAAAASEEQFRNGNADGAEVKVTLNDGTVHTAKLEDREPLSRLSLEEKFLNCASRACSATCARKLLTSITRFGEIADVRELTAEIASG